MFYAASALLKTKGLSYSKHTAVLSAFRQHFIKTGVFRVDFSEMYKILFDARRAGDYEILTKFEPDILRKNLKDAQEFITEVETWLRKHNFLST